MNLWVMVHAVVHGIPEKEQNIREAIYTCLTNKGWEKIHDHHISTSWKGFVKDTSYKDCFRIAERDFHNCAEKYSKTIDILVQVGPNEPEEL